MAKSFLFGLGRKKAHDLPRVARLAAWFEGMLLRLAWSLAKMMDPDRASDWGGKLFETFGPHLAKNAHVLSNLAIALPHMPDNERQAIARRVWHETGRVVAEFPHLDQICGSESDSRLEVVDHYGLSSAKESGQAVVFVTAHYGNWELAAGACRKVPFDLAVLHSNFSNPLIDDLLMEHRRSLGCEFIPRQSGARGMVKALRQSRSVGVVMDQRFDDGELVPFFGIPAATGTAAAAIAIKQGLDFVPVRVERKHGANYRITFFEPVAPRLDLPAKDRALSMTRDVLALFESWIRERPELWMCLKRRWPKSAHNTL